ncbi:MAG: H-NS histone family protein [Paracoccaceae bacterium]
MKINLESMSLKDLRELKKQVDKMIAGFEARKKREALDALEVKAKSLGFSLAELVGSSGVKRRKPAKPKYANPANKSETWTGRGRKPRWVEAALKSGKSLDDLAI